MNLSLFAQTIHPELVQRCASRTVDRDLYSLTVDITTDGHLLTFRGGERVLSEVVAAKNHPLPSRAKLLSQTVAGTQEASPDIDDYRIDYQSLSNLESVDPKMFVAIAQQLGGKSETEGLVHQFHTNGRIAFGAISYINIQSFIHHVKVRALHTFPETSAVLKSETTFKLMG